MELSFDTRNIRLVCEKNQTAEEKYGKNVARKLQSRLADICSAKNIFDLKVGNLTKFDDNDIIHYTLNLSEGYKLGFKANHPRIPKNSNGTTNWVKVKRVKITKIFRTNE